MTSAIFNANDPYEQLIAQMIRIESQPQLVLRERKSTQEVYRAVLNDFDSALSSLHTALEGLTDVIANPFAARAASVPEGAGFGATATDAAVPGAHTLTVEQLASADTRVSQRLTNAGTSLRSFFDSNGVQTFSIEVASPTEEDPNHRVPVAVTVVPVGTTDGEILSEIRQAITDAMSAAVADETITAEAAASASVVNETSDTGRLSIRSGDTGYVNRLGFTDSAGGLLDLLQVSRSAAANSSVTTTVPATAATLTGDAISVPLTIDNDNRDLDLFVDGEEQSVRLSKGLYLSVDDLAAELSSELGSDVEVDVVDGALRLTTAATGASTSLQITGGTGVSDLGFSVMAEATYGSDETTVTTEGASGGQLTSVGTSETDSALNARFMLNGLTLYRASNDVDDALDGVILTLQAPGTATPFSIGSDGDAVVKDVEGFLQKYNAVLDFIKRKSAVDPDAGTRGQFAGDVTVRGLRFSLRSDLLGAVSGQPEGLERLTDLGIEINDDGTLTLADRDALLGAVEQNASAVQNLFGDEDDGLATKLQAQLDRFLGASGMIKGRQDATDERIRRLDTTIERWDERLERRESVLRQQFAQLQEVVALLQGQQGTLDSLFYGGF